MTGAVARDYRDDLLAEFAGAEAAALERVGALEAALAQVARERETWRLIARVALDLVHACGCEIARLRAALSAARAVRRRAA